MSLNIGFIGIIGDEIRNAPEATLRTVAGIGFDGMEGAAAVAKALGVPVREARARLDAHGLKAAPQGRVAQDQSEAQWREVITTAREIGSRYVVDYYAPFDSRDSILKTCDYLNTVGRLCADEGLTFLYHNHDHEFRVHDGEVGFDLLLANTDPSIVKIELDVAWVTFGGGDPVAIIGKHPDRFPVLHMKDFAHLHPGSPTADGKRDEAVFAEVGTGVVNTAGVVDAARKAGVDWLVIEQDRMNTMGPMESLKTSFALLSEIVG